MKNKFMNFLQIIPKLLVENCGSAYLFFEKYSTPTLAKPPKLNCLSLTDSTVCTVQCIELVIDTTEGEFMW